MNTDLVRQPADPWKAIEPAGQPVADAPVAQPLAELQGADRLGWSAGFGGLTVE